MKNSSVLASFLAGLVTVSLQAGEPVAYKQVAPPPPQLYGVGFYGAIDMGANVYQNLRDSIFPLKGPFGFSLDLDQEHDVGIFGGIKLGYVFGTGVVRPTVEGDFFYNGFNFGGDLTLRDPVGDVLRQTNVNTWLNSGAFMANDLSDVSFGDLGQHLVGAGIRFHF